MKSCDKILLSFLICTKLMILEKEMDMQELKTFSDNSDFSSKKNKQKNPDIIWLSDKTWEEFCNIFITLPGVFSASMM